MDEKDLKPPQLILNGRTSHCVCSPDGKWLAVLVSASSSSFALYPLSIDGVVSGSCVTLRRGLHDDGPVNSMKFDPTSSSFVYLSDQDCCISTLNVANGSASWTPLVSIGSDCEPRIGTSTFTFVADDSDSISSSRQFSLLTLSQESDSENDRRLTLLDLPRCLQLRREALQQRLLDDPSGDQELEVSYEDCSSLFAEDELKRVPVSSMISSADGTLVAVTTISEQHQDDDEAKKLEKAESPCTTFFVFSLVSRNQWRMLFTESSSTGVLSFSPDNRWLCDGRKVWWLSQVTAHTVPLRVPSKVRCISSNDGRVFGVCFSSDSSLVFVQTHGVQCFAPSNSEPCEEAGDDHKAVAGDWRPVGEFYRVEAGEIAGLCVVASLPKAIIFSLRSGSPTPGVFWKCFV